MAQWKYKIGGIRIHLIRVFKSPWVMAAGSKHKGQEEWTGKTLKASYLWVRCKRYILRIIWVPKHGRRRQ